MDKYDVQGEARHVLIFESVLAGGDHSLRGKHVRKQGQENKTLMMDVVAVLMEEEKQPTRLAKSVGAGHRHLGVRSSG